MKYKIDVYEHYVANIGIEDRDGFDEIHLDDTIRVAVDADGVMLSIEVDNPLRFGDPFDQVAAEKVVAWARKQMAELDAS